MPQTYIEKREEARKMYVESGGQLLIKDIASKLEVPRTTVSGWKQADKWDKQLRKKPKDHRRGTPGNKNAAKPKPSMKGNRNNLRHGRYEQIKYASMTEEEKELLQVMPEICDDQIQMQIRLIAELEIRERRMYARIEETKKEMQEKNGLVTEYDQSHQKGVTVDDVKPGAQKKPRDITLGRKRGLDKIQEIESALTAVQKQKQAALLALHRLTEDKISREIEKERLAQEARRIDLMERRLDLIDPDADTDILKEAREILGGIKSAF